MRVGRSLHMQSGNADGVWTVESVVNVRSLLVDVDLGAKLVFFLLLLLLCCDIIVRV